MPKIFISYRRTDSFATTDRIEEKLRARFGADSVFRDIIDTPLGFFFRVLSVSVWRRLRAGFFLGRTAGGDRLR